MCFLILWVLLEHGKAFQMRLSEKYGNHEMVLIMLLHTLDLDSVLNNQQSPLQQLNLKKNGSIQLDRTPLVDESSQKTFFLVTTKRCVVKGETFV